ncbi:MAG: hypothetical protein P8Y85_01155 [Nitrospirota bacterium]|jgi:hypothetical protein
MGVKSLAEAIILQSMEDLSDSRARAESLEFFSGEAFRICAQMAGMKPAEQMRILQLVQKLSKIPHSAIRGEKVREAVRKMAVPVLYG